MNNLNKWTDTILSSKQRITIPIMTHPGIDDINETIQNAVKYGNIHAKAIESVSKLFPVAAKTSIMDLTVEAEAFGCKVEFSDHSMPHVIGTLVSNIEEVRNLKVPDLNCGRIPEFLKAAKLSVDINSDKPFFAGVIGPFSLAGRLFGMSEIMMACYIEPETIELLLEKCSSFIHSYCKELKKIGCDGVLIAEPAAGLMSNDDCMKFSSVYIKKIVEDLQDDNFLVILHNCGNRGHCTDAMLYTGAKACHFGNAANMVEILKSCPKDIVVMGNVDPVGVLKQLEPDEVREYVYKLLVKTSEFDNYVLSTGCDLPPGVPLKNIEAFFDALNDYNQ